MSLRASLENLVQESPDPLEAVEVVVDVCLGLGLADPQLLREAEGAHPVDDAEVDHLGLPAHIGADHLGEDSEDVRGGPGVDVLARFEGLDQGLVAGEVGEHAQLDLGVVGRDQHKALRGDEGLADPPALGRADGDVLEVGVAAREPPRGRDRLVVGGVDPPRLRVHDGGQGVDVGRFELRDAPVGQDLGGQIVRQGERRENLHVGRVALLRLSALRELQLVEEDDLQLLGRVDVEALARETVDPLLRLGQETLELPRHLPEKLEIDEDALLLHQRQDLDERHLHFSVQIFERQRP